MCYVTVSVCWLSPRISTPSNPQDRREWSTHSRLNFHQEKSILTPQPDLVIWSLIPTCNLSGPLENLKVCGSGVGLVNLVRDPTLGRDFKNFRGTH